MGKKILLADDSITIQKVIELTFSDEDFDVVTVGNGRLAIEKIQDSQPDLVLCDIIMPEKDGYEVCEFIKKNPATSHIPVLLLTGAFEPFDQERAARVGCDGFLAKPFEPQTLISKVKDLLAKASPPAPVAAPRATPPSPAAAAPAPPAPVAPPAPPVPAPVAAPPPPPAPAAADPVPVPTPAWAPPAPVAAPEPEVAYIADEPYPQDPGPFDSAEPAPELVADEPAETPAAVVDDLYGMPGTEPEELMAVDSDEAPVPAAPAEGWSETTMEVPLEARAQAGVQAMQPSPEREQVFEEVFEEEAPAAAPTPVPSAAPEPVSIAEPARPTAISHVPEEAYEAFVDEPMTEPPPQPDIEPESVPYAPVAAAQAAVAAPEPALEPADYGMPLDDLPEHIEPAQPIAMATAPPAESPAPAPFATVDDLDEAPSLSPDYDEPSAALPPVAPATPATLEAAPPAAPPQLDSFADVAPAVAPVEAPAYRSAAAEVPVPVDMVAQIAQRVVAQISEKVIREIAWEVIPELAEALIKKEIERLKAELQQT